MSRCDHCIWRETLTVFSQHGILPRACLLDAGCGPGLYSIELAARGYRVTGLDASSAFVDLAHERMGSRSPTLRFVHGDMLNDLIQPSQRQQAFSSFAQGLRDGGLLLFDVRESRATQARKQQEPVMEKVVQTPQGVLSFRSETSLDPDHHRLVIAESHRLTGSVMQRAATYQFVMQCWTEDELRDCLATAGFVPLHWWGEYAHATPAGVTDRLVCLAQRKTEVAFLGTGSL
jgi:SAM-dependent methyltransferase